MRSQGNGRRTHTNDDELEGTCGLPVPCPQDHDTLHPAWYGNVIVQEDRSSTTDNGLVLAAADQEQDDDALDLLNNVDSEEELGLNMKDHSPSPTRPSASMHNQHLLYKSGALFPPFYNRPPTPLPPSPSLTSLLRPTFSAANSHRTTPESSDLDLPSGSVSPCKVTSKNAASTTTLATSARHAATVPRASPKVPTYEYYGFALYLGSSAAFLVYILWAYVPAPLLHQMGIHYYPNRWWALAVPCWLAVLIMYIYAALASYNTRYLTLPLDSCENLVDECAQIALIDRSTGEITRELSSLGTEAPDGGEEMMDGPGADRSRKRSLSTFQFSVPCEADWNSFWSIGTDAVMDVPIGGVCELLYGDEE